MVADCGSTLADTECRLFLCFHRWQAGEGDREYFFFFSFDLFIYFFTTRWDAIVQVLPKCARAQTHKGTAERHSSLVAASHFHFIFARWKHACDPFQVFRLREPRLWSEDLFVCDVADDALAHTCVCVCVLLSFFGWPHRYRCFSFFLFFFSRLKQWVECRLLAAGLYYGHLRSAPSRIDFLSLTPGFVCFLLPPTPSYAQTHRHTCTLLVQYAAGVIIRRNTDRSRVWQGDISQPQLLDMSLFSNYKLNHTGWVCR